jgi:imidazolonepropionase
MTAVDSARRIWTDCILVGGEQGSVPLRDAAIVTAEGRIQWLGPAAQLPTALGQGAARHSLGGRWLTPGFIDCHTHLLFGGQRAAEHAMRARGASYEDIAARGGGILSTVRATRAASDAQLLRAARVRLRALQAEGVTGVEIKSGYGLSLPAEERLLRLARQLGADSGLDIHATFLGAHAVPPEYAGRADAYIDDLIREWLPHLAAAGLIDSVDVYCESLAFDVAQSLRLLRAATALGLPVRMHAEQRSNIGASQLAASCGALSCDHLEYTQAADIEALARAGTVAVLLPVAWHVLRDTQRPPVDALRTAGVPLAVATDCNPGTAPGESLLLALHLAVRDFGLRSDELLASVTWHAARALGWQARRGNLAVGAQADFAVWNIDSLDELGYWVGHNPCAGTVVRGQPDARLAQEINA